VNYCVAVAKVVVKDKVMMNNILPGMRHTGTIKDRYDPLA
jgi:hypothetical protein